MAEVEGTGEGTGQGTGTGTGQVEGLWRAQLPADLKDHELLTPFKTMGDAGKAYIETVGKVKDYEGKVKEYETKLTGAIFKPGEKATPEEISAYRKSMGIPEKPTEYEFPKGDGIEHDEKMVSWAQGVFHEAGLSKEEASFIGQKWDGFIKGMVEAEDKMAEDTKVANEKKFREQFKSDEEHKAGMELSRRFWKKVTNTDFDEVYKEAEAWQVPLFMSYVFNTAKLVGEDWTPKGGTGSTGEVKMGIVYDKTDFSKYKEK